MKLLRASEQKTEPWKNGGGVTRPIAVHPPGAGMDDFDWRLSSALVGSDGPFSSFPDIDRTLLVLDRAGLGLTINGAAELWLTPQSEPLVFPGEAKVIGRLRYGAVVDLNIMVRRGRWTCRTERVAFVGQTEIAAAGDVGFVMMMSEAKLGADTLHTGDVVRLDRDETVRLGALDGLCRAVVVELRRAPSETAP